MASCPNINSQEWKTLEAAVGKFAAYKYYVETGGKIGTPEEVLRLQELRKNRYAQPSLFSEYPSLAEITEKTYNENNFDTTLVLDNLKQTRAGELADKMSRALGIDYEFVTPEQAAEITKDTINPWNGQPAFFLGGQVYFIQGRLTTDNVLHEFAHPFVRSIAKENPELFNNIYNQLTETAEGQAIIDEVREMYPELDLAEQDELFKEEVIVKAIEEHGKNKVQNVKIQGPFAKAINNFLYALKQLLRKVFGKSIKVSKLNTDTTINELADILTEGNKISINTQLVTNEEIVAYNRENFEQIAGNLNDVKARDMQTTINTFYDTISKQVNQLYNNKNYEELIPILRDQYLRGDLQEILSNLKKHQTMIKNAKDNLINEIENTKSRSQAMTETLLRLDDIMIKMYENAQDIQDEGDTQENMHKAYYYGKFISHYSKLISDLETALRKNNVPASAAIRPLVSSIKNSIENTQDIINEMKADGARDALYDQLEPIKRSVSERYEEIISNLRKKEAPQNVIDNIYKEYHGMTEAQWDRFNELAKLSKETTLSTAEQNEYDRLISMTRDGVSITREKIEAQLKGQIGDSNVFSGYLEGYLYNNDPIIGGLALYTKNALTEVMIVAQQKYNSFAEEMRDPLKRAGFNPSMLGRLGERTTFEDKVARIDPETGELKVVKVHTFLNKFKNYRAEKEELRHAMATAHDAYQRSNSEADRQAFIEAVDKQKRFLRDYFHQEYVDEFYENEALLSDDAIGKEASYLRGELFERMNELTMTARSQQDEIAVADEIDSLWREYAQMHSRYYPDGKLKQGRDAEIANRLRQYRQNSREFYEWKVRKGVFENEYFNYLQELRSKNIPEGSAEWKKALDDWKKVNTRKTIKSEYYERRNDIIYEIKEIMKKLSDSERKELDQSNLWEDIFDKTGGYRDSDNQLNGSEMSESTIADIKELQEKLQQIKENGLRRSGLTREQEQELNELYAQSKTDKSVWPRINELNELKSQQSKLNAFDIAKLNTLYAELGELSSKEATSYYAEQANAVIAKIDPALLEKTQFQKDFGNMNIDSRSADYLLDPKVVEELSSISPEFAEWFAKNHIKKKKWNKATKQEEDTYERLYVWSITKPADPGMMETYEIKDAAGRVIDTVEGLPTLKYYNRTVKLKYKNRKIRGVTIDNQGQWLPKEFDGTPNGAKDDRFVNEKYEALKNSTDPKDQALFEALEIMKKYHLDNQEGLSYNNRLGYDIPRYRKSNLELARAIAKDPIGAGKEKVGGLSLLMKRIKDFFVRTADQAEDGMSYENNFNLVRADIFDNDMTGIPISGLYDIELGDVSMDVTTSLNRYMLSAENQKKLVQISPIVRSIQDTVNDPENAIQDINKVHAENFKATNLLRYFKKDKNNRANAVNNWIEKHFEGKTQKGLGAESPFLQNFSNFLFKRASFTFFALNIPSALKNSLGMKFQQLIESAAGRYVDPINLQRGNGFAYRAMAELSTTQLYQRGAKSHLQQMVEVFEVIPDKFQQNFGQTMSRTLAKDVASLSFFTTPRVWVEQQATLQLFGGMMYQKKVDIKTEDGTKQISYVDAFETIDGQIRLKEGIDVRYGLEPIYHALKPGDTIQSLAERYNIPEDAIEQVFKNVNIEAKLEEAQEIEELREDDLSEIDLDAAEDEMERTKMLDRIEAINRKYDKQLQEKTSIKIDNSEFKFYKNRMQQINNNMGGAYAKFDQPEAQRYLAFRWVSYLRRFFTTMAINRWGFRGSLKNPMPRLNPGTGDVQMGFYVQFAKTVIQTAVTGGKHLKFARKEEKEAAVKMAVEVGMLMLLNMLMSVLFGWDPEDDERFEKLRAKSGAAPGLFVKDDEDRPFDLAGWAELHALHLMMQVRGENEQFNLLTGGSKLYTELLDMKGVALGPTVETYETIYQDLKGWWGDDPKAFYKRQVGPLTWQQKGDAKFYNHFMKMWGVTGKQYDPALAIKNFQSYYVRP